MPSIHQHSHDSNKPTPAEDFREIEALPWGWSKTYFGFASPQQVNAWFCPDERRELAAAGFRLREFEARNVIEGDHQVMFNRDTAILVSDQPFPIEELAA